MTKLTEKKVVKAQKGLRYDAKLPEITTGIPTNLWYNSIYNTNFKQFPHKYTGVVDVIPTDSSNTDTIIKEQNPDFWRDNNSYNDANYTSEPTTWNKAKSLAKPAISAAVIWENFNKLRQTKDAAKNIIAPVVTAPLAPNTPIRALDPSLVNQYLKQVGSLSTRKTADSTMNSINDQMLNIKKLEAYDKLSAKQVDNLFKERARYDATEKENAINAIKARNEQSKLSVGIYNKKASIDASYKKAQQELLNRSVDEMFKGMDNKIRYNAGRNIQNTQIQLDALHNSIANKRNYLAEHPDAEGNSIMSEKLASDIENYDLLSKKLKLPSFSEVAGSW